jgi:hypothetical protein
MSFILALFDPAKYLKYVVAFVLLALIVGTIYAGVNHIYMLGDAAGANREATKNKSEMIALQNKLQTEAEEKARIINEKIDTILLFSQQTSQDLSNYAVTGKLFNAQVLASIKGKTLFIPNECGKVSQDFTDAWSKIRSGGTITAPILPLRPVVPPVVTKPVVVVKPIVKPTPVVVPKKKDVVPTVVTDQTQKVKAILDKVRAEAAAKASAKAKVSTPVPMKAKAPMPRKATAPVVISPKVEAPIKTVVQDLVPTPVETVSVIKPAEAVKPVEVIKPPVEEPTVDIDKQFEELWNRVGIKSLEKIGAPNAPSN